MHPDRSGGLGFVLGIGKAFAPVLLGQGVLMAGSFANRIFITGAKLTDFKMDIAALLLLMLASVLAPLLVFVPGPPSPGARACGNTGRWHSATRASLTTSGCGAVRRWGSR
jgi:hypothetical protein